MENMCCERLQRVAQGWDMWRALCCSHTFGGGLAQA